MLGDGYGHWEVTWTGEQKNPQDAAVLVEGFGLLEALRSPPSPKPGRGAKLVMWGHNEQPGIEEARRFRTMSGSSI